MSLLQTTPQLDRHHATAEDVAMMRRAIEIAKVGWAREEVPVGAVIFRDGIILAEAHNLREVDRDPTAHAEILALREASKKLGEWRLNDCTLVVTLEPCTMCAGAIVNARVGRLVYGASDPKAGAIESLYQVCDDQRLNHRPQIICGVLAPECRGLLRDFFKERRKANKAARDTGSLP
jgi:tRNA(adenine34) deaminase